MTTLTLRNLRKEYATGNAAVSGLDLTVETGEMMVLLGPSGCGKTTALRLVAGLLQPTSGDVLFDGVSVLDLPSEKRGAIMVFQEHTLFPFMSTGENVAYGLKMRKMVSGEIKEKVSQALESVQLAGFEERRPDSLSSGQRQRAALARALVVQPRMLLLDEPLSNLDPGLRSELRHMVRSLQQKAGITTLFVTHDQAEAVEIGDRIALMMEGRLRQLGQPRDFFEDPADAQIARFFGSNNFLAGMKRGESVNTSIGEVEICPSAISDGPVLLAIRPEVIEIGANRHNNYPARVQSCRFGSPGSQCQVSIDEVVLNIVTSPFHEFRDQRQIVVHLPKERIQIFAAEEKN